MHYDRVSHVSYVFALCALGVHIVCYVLCIMYYDKLCITHCHWESTSSVMYYVLRIMRIMHYALGVHIVYYVLRITYYVLCITHWESTSYVMYYVLCIVYDASYIAHFRQAHHVCVLAATFYVLAALSRAMPESVVTSAHTTPANLWQP